jgi:hypothetical protein
VEVCECFAVVDGVPFLWFQSQIPVRICGVRLHAIVGELDYFDAPVSPIVRNNVLIVYRSSFCLFAGNLIMVEC